MATLYGANVVRDGLVLHLDAANPKSYPGSGATWFDLSGNGKDATLYNGVTISNGASEQQYSTAVYEGGNDFVRVDDYSVAATPAPLTYTCWVNFFSEGRDTAQQTMNLMGPAGTSATGAGMALGILNDERLWGIVYDSSGNQYQLRNTSGEILQADTWYMASMTHDGSTASLYLNNKLYHQVSLDGYLPYTTQNFTIGLNRIYFHFGGYMSDVKVYNKALSLSEIQQNFNATRGRFGI
jgi:hypothetical protein